MPISIFEITGVPGKRRERIEAAVIAAGRNVSRSYEAWVGTAVFRGGLGVFITGANGFERMVAFPLDEDPVLVAERIRETLES